MSNAAVRSVMDLFAQWGGETYDEDLAQLDHALQTAALAQVAGAGDELIAAALLHDVGHLLELAAHQGAGGADDARHEDSGAAWLRPTFPVAVTAPIALHVRAKRYLCAVEPTYVDGLSHGSVISLAKQGGLMSAKEASSFARLPGADDAIRLRRWDDAGKVDGLDVPGLDSYAELLGRVARSASVG